MNKISKRLFWYMLGVLIFFSVIVFVGFYGILKNQMLEHHKKELYDKVISVRDRIEESFNSENQQTMCVCLKYLDEITLTEVYIVKADGTPFICEMCDGCEKDVPDEIEQFGFQLLKMDIGRVAEVIEKKDCLEAGAVISEDARTTSAVIVVEKMGNEKDNIFLPVLVLSGCLLFSMALSGILAGYLVKKFMHPLKEIAGTVSHLADGDYDVKISRFEDDEIGNLARQTNLLACKLCESSRKAEQMQQIQKDFFANISHELRTPVAVIRSSLEAIKDQVIPEKEIPEYQQQILTETVMLQRLVDDMLELSRLENKEFLIEKECIDIRSVLEDSIRAVRMLANRHNISIMYEEPDEELLVLGDYSRMRQMFVIALENAVKYSEEDKKIYITVKEKEKDFYISIRDEGCGIPEDKQKYLFEKFYRVSCDRKEGTGLGLAIMKNIANRHGIQINLYSAFRKGTKITYIIPKMTQECHNKIL